MVKKKKKLSCVWRRDSTSEGTFAAVDVIVHDMLNPIHVIATPLLPHLNSCDGAMLGIKVDVSDGRILCCASFPRNVRRAKRLGAKSSLFNITHCSA